MVLFDECFKQCLGEYGIEIPILDSRCTKTWQALSAVPGLQSLWWALPFAPEPITREDIERAHAKSYVDKLFGPELEAELIKTYELVQEGHFHRYDPACACRPLSRIFQTVLNVVAGTYQTAREALQSGFCFFMGGGLHHAMPAYGSGFCLLNDMVISARKLRAHGLAKRFWIIDVDAHKGDGTAVLCASDPGCATLSIHMGSSWPLDDEPYDSEGRLKAPFHPSTIDIPMFKGEDDLYNSRLKAGLEELERISFKPDLVFVVCGADPYEKDELPSSAELQLTLEQMMERDRLVYRFLMERKLHAAYLMAGGYGGHVWQVYSQFLTEVLLERAPARQDFLLGRSR